MKRLVLSLAAVAVLVVSSAAAAFAQSPTPPTTQPYWGHMGWGGAGSYGNYDPASNPTLKGLADKIGIGAADLVKELQVGKSVAEVAKARSVDEQTLVDLLLAPQTDLLKIQVKYGYLTQDQADSAQELAADRIKYSLEQKGFYGGFGYGGGMMGGGFGGGMMGGGFGGGMMGGGFGGGMMGGGFGGGMMGRGLGGMMGGFGGMMGRGFGPWTPTSPSN